MSSDFFYVFVKDGRSRVVPESIESVVALEDDGWEMIWDSARTEFDGHARAARLRRTVPEAWTDDHGPSPMREPLVLYRSMSLQELGDVLVQGEVRGKGNRFNEFDSRRFVFFGSILDDHLTWHGEDIERVAINEVLEFEHYTPTFDALAEERRSLFSRFEAAAIQALDRQAAAYVAAGYEKPSSKADVIERWRFRGVPTLGELGLPSAGVLTELKELMRENSDRMRACQDGFRKAVAERTRELRAQMTDADYTSAVLEFSPMSHGLHYVSGGEGSEGSQRDEYGFFPGSVFLSDVVRVHWVRNREVIDTTGLDEAAGRLEALRANDEVGHAFGR